jgi:hypothetical protein
VPPARAEPATAGGHGLRVEQDPGEAAGRVTPVVPEVVRAALGDLVEVVDAQIGAYARRR